MVHLLQSVFRNFGANPLFALLCVGAIPLLWAVERRVAAWVGVALLAAAAIVLHSLLLPKPPSPYFAARILAFLGEAGASAAAVLGFLSIRRADGRLAFGIFAAVLLANFVTGKYLGFTGRALPVTFDRVVAVADAQLRVQPSFILGRLFERITALRDFCFLTYNGLLFALLLLCAIRLRQDRGPAITLIVQFMAAGVVGSMLYAVLPVCGPIYAFPGQFPWHPPMLGLRDAVATVLPHAPRNGVPSLHFTWALLFFLGSSGQLRIVRAVFAIFLAGTILATMGMGEHYFLDLVIAVPFACAIASLRRDSWHRARGRLTALLLFAATLGWMLVLRFDAALLLSEWRLPVAAAATVLIPLYGSLHDAPRSAPLDARQAGRTAA